MRELYKCARWWHKVNPQNQNDDDIIHPRRANVIKGMTMFYSKTENKVPEMIKFSN